MQLASLILAIAPRAIFRSSLPFVVSVLTALSCSAPPPPPKAPPPSEERQTKKEKPKKDSQHPAPPPGYGHKMVREPEPEQ